MAESQEVMLCSVFPQARQTSTQTPMSVMHLSFWPQLGQLPTPKLFMGSAAGGMGTAGVANGAVAGSLGRRMRSLVLLLCKFLTAPLLGTVGDGRERAAFCTMATCAAPRGGESLRYRPGPCSGRHPGGPREPGEPGKVGEPRELGKPWESAEFGGVMRG